MSSWRHKLSCHVDFAIINVIMARKNILPSRLRKNYMPSWRDSISCQVDFTKSGCRHGDINIILPSRLRKNYMPSWRDSISCQVNFTKSRCRHGDINHLVKSTSQKLRTEAKNSVSKYMVTRRYFPYFEFQHLVYGNGDLLSCMQLGISTFFFVST